jgi:PAS domain S-box-containing protein
MHENGDHSRSHAGLRAAGAGRREFPAAFSTALANRELASVAPAAALKRRSRHSTDLAAENHAMTALAEAMTASPEIVLQKVADTAMAPCGAHSAGVCLVEGRRTYRWHAIVGQWAPYLGKSTPHFSPCGMVVHYDAPLLFSHPERDFPCLDDVTPPMDEGLSIPFYANGVAVGTMWVMAHDETRRFDAEHLRTMTSLGAFAAAAYQSLQAVDARRHAGEKLQETAEALQHLTSTIDSCEDAIITCDLDGIVTTWNRAAERLFGYSSREAIGQPARSLIAPESEDHAETLERLRDGRHIDTFECVHHRKDHRMIDVSLTISPIRDTAGRLIGFSKVARDDSARRAALEQQDLLIREMSHRVKNLFAVAGAVVSLSARFAASPQNLALAVEERFAALGRALDLTCPGLAGDAQQAPRSTALHELVRIIFSPFIDRSATNRERLFVTGHDVAIGSRATANIALVLHELATNAAKYGALLSPHGTVHVHCAAEEEELLLTWTEHDAPPIDGAPARGGFGDMLIHGVVHDTFGGHVIRDWRRDGLIVRLSVPVQALQS